MLRLKRKENPRQKQFKGCVNELISKYNEYT